MCHSIVIKRKEVNIWTKKFGGLNIYTKTVKDGKHEKIIGVIEGSVTKMMKAYPDEFSFMRHETKRSLRAKGIKKSS